MIPIVFSTDHRYVMPAGVAICSLLAASHNEQYDIFVLISDDVDEADCGLLRKQVAESSASAATASRISFIRPGDCFSGSYEVRGITEAAYYRLLIPWLIPQYDKIFYSDVDVVFQRGLSGSYSTDLGECYIAGVNFDEYSNGLLTPHIKKLGLDAEKYINSGFLLINSRLMRSTGLKDTFLKYAKRKYEYQDQDILNIICKDRIAYLPRENNRKASQMDGFCTEECGLIHYTGIKPWVGFTHCWEQWWEIYRKSVFYDSALRGRVLFNIMTVQGWTNEEFKTGFMPLARLARKLSLKFPAINKCLIRIIRIFN